MAQIQIRDLTFYYEGSPEVIFDHISFSIDSSWKLGLIGRNGKGKTTLLNLLMGKQEYTGNISGVSSCDYFPYDTAGIASEQTAAELIGIWKPSVQMWQVLVQMSLLEMDKALLYRPFETLSFGEKTRIMLAVLFSGENEFLLIDEPTNHLDQQARSTVKKYLAEKSGFILVSHDRDLLDAVIDHVLVLNKNSIIIESGNFSSWWENKEKEDAYALAENEKHRKEINKLRTAADRSSRWADKNEQTKIGFDPVKEHDRNIATRAYIGAKTKKMQSRVKSYKKRMDREIEEKEGLLNDIENIRDLKITPLSYHKEVLVRARDLSLQYIDSRQCLFENLSFEIRRGDRIFIKGGNGSGKSSLIHAILEAADFTDPGHKTKADSLLRRGELSAASGLRISYISQDTSFLKGTIREFCSRKNLEESLYFAVLRQLDVDRREFDRNMENMSEGQKKKILIAASLVTPAHLYIWDEPLNYIDVFSRMQIERLILQYQPTMLLVDHDVRFMEKIAAGEPGIIHF